MKLLTVIADSDSSFIPPLFVITVIFNFLAALVVTGDYCKKINYIDKGMQGKVEIQ